jgi:hypothetical protein
VLILLPRLFMTSLFFCFQLTATKLTVLSDGFPGPSRGFALFTPPTAGTCLGIAQHAPGRRGSIGIGVEIKDTTTCHAGSSWFGVILLE